MKTKRIIQSTYHLPYNPDLVPLARQMRKAMTRAECRLWFEYLKDFPYPVHKQHPIDQYIVDFYCAKLKLVIEVDGDSHFMDETVAQADLERTKQLESLGLKVIRFTNNEVFTHLDGVIEAIEEMIKEDK
jgi:very-short-patch-repair endonuclease